MKIGVLTLKLHINYGGILQAYALQRVLKDMGHDVELLDIRENQPLSVQRIIVFIKQVILRHLMGRKDIYHELAQPIIYRHTNSFIRKCISQRRYHSYEEIDASRYDAIIVGSDQVWRPMYFTWSGGIQNAYLAFAEGENIKRISYAASFGTDEWEYTPKQTAECGRLLKKFDAVSVREQGTVENCRKYFGVDAQCVLDPTLLLSTEHYIAIASKAKRSVGNLFYYVLDKDSKKMAIIESVAKEKGLNAFTVIAKAFEQKDAKIKDQVQPPIENWLRGFMDAEFVITDSFHGTVFSIIFNKPFAVLLNKERGIARFESLLSQFELMDRIVTNEEEIITLAEIDWKKVNATREKLIKASKAFLLNALN